MQYPRVDGGDDDVGVGPQLGVEQVLAMLREELDVALTLVGCPSCANIDSDLIWRGSNLIPRK